MGNCLSVLKRKDARADDQPPKKRESGASFWSSVILLCQRLPAFTPVTDQGAGEKLPGRYSESEQGTQTARDSVDAPYKYKTVEDGDSKSHASPSSSTCTANDSVEAANVVEETANGESVEIVNVDAADIADTALVAETAHTFATTVNAMAEMAEPNYMYNLAEASKDVAKEDETDKHPIDVANITQNANKTIKGKKKVRDSPKPSTSREISNTSLNLQTGHEKVAIDIVKRDPAKQNGQTSSTASIEIRKTKVSEFKVPKEPYADFDYPSAPMLMLRRPHVNKIPDVARTESSEKITWVQRNPQGVSGQQFWATRTPMFEPPSVYLGERLLERLGSVTSMRKSWVIPQCRQIETLKLEESVYPGIKVKPSKRWKYSTDTVPGNSSRPPRRPSAKKSRSNNKTVNHDQAGPSKAPSSKPRLSQRSSHSDMSSATHKSQPSLVITSRPNPSNTSHPRSPSKSQPSLPKTLGQSSSNTSGQNSPKKFQPSSTNTLGQSSSNASRQSSPKK